MRILIISDTHGRTNTIRDVFGDEEYIYDNVTCPIHMVAGNNDWTSDLPMQEEFMIGRYKVFITHGHRYNVHYGTDYLQELVKYDGYDIVMYGHTHVQNLERYGGAYIVNPGSLAYANSFAYPILIPAEDVPFFAENELKPKRRMRSIFEDMWGDREE